jgi:hypothetical protein
VRGLREREAKKKIVCFHLGFCYELISCISMCPNKESPKSIHKKYEPKALSRGVFGRT